MTAPGNRGGFLKEGITMLIQSNLSKTDYISSFKRRMGSSLDFGEERFTGLTVGKCFYVTHHAGYEWNCRITNQKNAALGYIDENPDGCRVRFILFKGMLCPTQFLLWCVMTAIIGFFTFISHNNWTEETATIIFGCCAGALILGALIETFSESMTERSEEGEKCLLSMLHDPSDLFSYLNHS